MKNSLHPQNDETLRDQIISHILARAEISKTVLRKMLDNTITKKDPKTGEISYFNPTRRYYMDTSKVVSEKKFNKLMATENKTMRIFLEIALENKTLDSFELAFSDYFQELRFPEESKISVDELADFLCNAISGNTVYAGERNPADAVALERREQVVLAMVEHYYWARKIQYDLVPTKNVFSVTWRMSRLQTFIYSYAKTDKNGSHSSVERGRKLLYLANEGYEIPPSALTLWLCMSPRDAFDTEAGRAEWDRLYEQSQREETERRIQEPDEVLRNVYSKGGYGPYPENHWSSRIIKGEQDFLPATPYPQSLCQVVLPKLTPRQAERG